ncbi:DUF2066 domain-containing protein [Thiolapillus sp.]
MKIRPLFYFCLLLSLLPAFALAVGSGLYSAEVPVADATPEARKASIRQAFEKVLIKASGHRNLKGRSGMESLLENAEDHVQQFRYRNQAADVEGEPDQRWMWVAFEKGAVQKALRDLGLSVWEKGRPEVLLWLVQEIDGHRTQMDPERDVMLVQALEVAAEQRGLPLLLPLMDLEDQSALRVSDIWTVDRESVERASNRYGEPLVLLGRLRKAGNGWQAKWTLLLPDRQQDFSTASGGAEETVSAGINKAMDWLADQYVPGSDIGEAEPVMLRFLDIDDVREYSRVIQLLELLDVVSEYAILESLGDQLLIRAKVRGGRDILVQRLSLETVLAPVASIPDETGVQGGLELTYRLR